MLEPKSFFPAPALIAIPNNTPPSVIREIRNAFSMAWIDPNVAASQLRLSAEYIMDDFGNAVVLDEPALAQWADRFTERMIATSEELFYFGWRRA